ncbi:MAG TPA: hypothetical protein VK897_16610 [Anaerolineales bacterium]|nr:hypothetical protein [Anaerolineales bacterium]
MDTYSFFRRLVLLGTPIALGTLEMFHPVAITGDALTDLGHRIPIWMTVHLLQLPLFGLMALAIHFLLDGAASAAATVSRIALWFFIVFYISFDTLAGISAGIVLDGALDKSPEVQQEIVRLFEAFQFSPVALAINALGGLGWIVSVVAAAYVVGKAGVPRFAILCLIISMIFAMHIPPTGPLGLAFFLIAAAGIEFGHQRLRAHASMTAVG